MDSVHIHLLLNHLPIVGALVGTLILAFGLFFKRDIVAKTGLVVLFLVPVISFPTQISGENTEHALEALDTTTQEDHHRIHEHSKWAHYAFFCSIAMGLLALLAILGGIFSSSPQKLNWVVLVLALATLGLMVQAGNTGGKIKHEEIR